MHADRLSIYSPETSLKGEIAFKYKKELYKVHVSVSMEEEKTFYKLYFKNNIETTDKSLMKLFRETNSDGSFTWKCKEDYFSYNNTDLAAIAGEAIDKFLFKQGNQLI
jgi:hypothetical protein